MQKGQKNESETSNNLRLVVPMSDTHTVCGCAVHGLQSTNPFLRTPTKGACNCNCLSFIQNGMRVCHASGPCGPHEICTQPPPVTVQTIMTYPWLAAAGIVKELASHSTMPNAREIFDVVRTVQLTEGSNSIRRGYVQDSGYRMDGNAPTIATNKTKGTQWWQLASDDSQKTQVLTLWDDPDLKWITTGDIHHSTMRLPVTETITFYADHWEQVNANGVFTDKVEAYVTHSEKANPVGPTLAKDMIAVK
jgi:hypothetical protein